MLISLLFLISTTSALAKRPEHVFINYTAPEPILADHHFETLFQPIRIHLHEVNSNADPLRDAENSLIRAIFHGAVRKATDLLRVFPVSGPLRLAYSQDHICEYFVSPLKCRKRWDVIPQDTCYVDGFRIPSEHYEEFRLYHSDNESDYRVDIPAGPGLPNTDIVIYTSFAPLQYCILENTGVLGFTKICKRDQFGRPIAAFINICPVDDVATNKLKLQETVFHELLHALGFIGSSLPFIVQNCHAQDGQLACEFVERGVMETRIPFPRRTLMDYSRARGHRYEFVGRHTEAAWMAHLDCKDLRYTSRGPAWFTYQEVDPQGREDTKVGDHWRYESMMGSIMSSQVKEPYMQVLDNMTVAVFKDMGWYRVRDVHTDLLMWGRDAGCTFADPDHCTEVNEGKVKDRYLCANSGERGCHYLHLHKGTCTELDRFQVNCRYYKPDREGECFINRPVTQPTLEETGIDSRCFMSNLTSGNNFQSPEPACYRRRCVGGLIDIHINGTWVNCPYEQTITVVGLAGVIECPPFDVLCTERDLRLADMLEAEPNKSTTPPIPPSITQTTTRATTTLRSAIFDWKTTSTAAHNVLNGWLFFFIILYSI